jgi:flagellar biosynthesis anti-sigma factor FlgM
MRIDLSPGNGIEGAHSTETQRSNAGGKASDADRRNGTVEFESSMGKLVQSALNSPEVRQAKVEALKAQVDAKTYQISNHSIASALLEQMRRT